MQGKVISILVLMFAVAFAGERECKQPEIDEHIKKCRGEILEVIKEGEARICKHEEEIKKGIEDALGQVNRIQEGINAIADKENEKTCQKIGICREILQVDQEKVNKYKNGYGDCKPSPSINTIPVLVQELNDLYTGVITVPAQCKEQVVDGEKYKACCDYKIEQTLKKTRTAKKLIESIEVPCNIKCIKDETKYLVTYLEAIKEELLLCIKYVK